MTKKIKIFGIILVLTFSFMIFSKTGKANSGLRFLNNSNIELGIGEKSQLSFSKYAKKRIKKIVKWKSSNPEVANIKRNGKFEALSEGNTTISAKAKTVSGYAIICCTITVTTNETERINDKGTLDYSSELSSSSGYLASDVVKSDSAISSESTINGEKHVRTPEELKELITNNPDYRCSIEKIDEDIVKKEAELYFKNYENIYDPDPVAQMNPNDLTAEDFPDYSDYIDYCIYHNIPIKN